MSRKNTGVIGALLTAVARAPWPLGVGLAIASFVGFSLVDRSAPPATNSVEDIGSAVISHAVSTLIPIATYLVPALFLIGAGASFLSGIRRGQLLQSASSEPGGLGKLSWQEFERLIHAFFERRGFRVTDRGGRVADGGVDLELERNGKRFLVQCKHWRSRKVGVPAVRELYGVVSARQVDGGFFVTSSAFTDEALYFARNLPIELIDGSILSDLLQLQEDGSAIWPPPVRKAIEPRFDPNDVPRCPSCGGTMVERTAKRGPRTGQRFWGCSSYPACKGTRSIDG